MLLEIVIFGILQGIFEWLPISSQGNLVIMMIGLFGINPNEAMNLAIFLHTGTVLSAVVYFRGDVFSIIKGLTVYKPGFSSDKDSMTSFFIISTIITGILGLFIYRAIQDLSFSGEIFLALVGISLIITGFIQKNVKKAKNDFSKPNLKDSIISGILQSFAIVPGISRSGITVSGLLLRRYSSDDALKISFLMSIPAVIAAEIGLGLMGSLPNIDMLSALMGIFVSFIFGLITIHGLLKIAKRIKFWIFCVIMGILSLIPFLLTLF